MQAPNQQYVIWGNQAYPVVTTGSGASQSSHSNGKLWGSSVRTAMGFIQIIFGIIEFALGVTLICLPLNRFWVYPFFGWGIWNGVFAGITGFFGVYSKHSKCMVIAYMVMSIIAAVLSATCCGSTASFIPLLSYYRHTSSYYDDGFYDYRSYYGNEYFHANAHFAISIILVIIFALEMLISILGASFTCGALTSRNNHQQVVYQINAQPPTQPLGSAPPYTTLEAQIQPQPYNSADSCNSSAYTPLNLGQGAQQPGNGANLPGPYASHISPK